MNEDVTFGPIVKERRGSLGLTQAELARRVGCAAITIRKIEADALRPSVQIAEQLARALNVPEAEQLAFIRLARVERAPSPLPSPPPIPEEIGQADLSGRAIRTYQLGQRLGTGGYGAVYAAVQATVEREVAVKIILPQYANHPDFVRRFEAEAQLVARLEHPHIVPLYDYWREPHAAYLVMRLLRGGSVEDRLKNGPLTLEAVVQLLEQVGAALYAAHRAGVIHRDLKPANILLDEDGNSYLADFGIAKNLCLAEQTRAEELLGSPAYLSPEQIKAEPIRPQTDIYCLGIMLYELLTGQKPFKGPTPFAYIQQHLDLPLPSLVEQRPDLPATLDPVINRATAKDPAARHPNILSLLDEFRQAVALPVESGQRLVINRGDGTALENPYKGLRPFGEADAADFFGRDTLVQALLARLAEEDDLARFLAVVGPSGSGKSSVVKAGLAPALRRGGLPCSEDWFIVEMLPGSHPLEELKAALLRVAATPPESLLAQLQEEARGLLRAVRRILPADGQTELVLVIDQFEELFTLCSDEAVRAHFMASLVTAVLEPRSRLRVVITLRADFTDRPLQYVDFGELVRQRTEFVLPLTPDELEEVIRKPAERVGLTVEPGLPETIIADLGEQPGTLPLLQYTLTELFERRVGRVLTLGAYQASGGVRGSLTSRADELYCRLDETGQQAARQIFLRLITLGDITGDGLTAPDTRRRVLQSELASIQPLSSLPPVAGWGENELASPPVGGTAPTPRSGADWVEGRQRLDNVIDLFGRHRLLTFDRDPLTRSPTVEVAHEALIREWSRLRQWLHEDREFLLWQQRLRAALHQWQANEQDEGALLRGAPLAEAENWFNQRRADLSEGERKFIQFSLDLRERRASEREAQRQSELEAAQKLAETEKARAEEQRQAAIRLRQRAVVLTGALVVAGILAVMSIIFGRQASQKEAEVLAQQAIAVAEAGQRATAQANAEAERAEAEHQAQVALSRELAAAALTNLDVDQERSVLLAVQALAVTYTKEAEEALHNGLANFRLKRTLGAADVIVKPIEFAYGPKGRYLVIGTENGELFIWDTDLDQKRLAWSGHSELISEIAFSPDGSTFATISDDTTVRLWDFRQLIQTSATSTNIAPIATLQNVNCDISQTWTPSLYFSRAGTELVTAACGTIQIWDVATGQEIRSFPGQTEELWAVLYSPDGNRLITYDGNGPANVWDAITGEKAGLLEPNDTVTEITFNPDDTWMATGSMGGTVKIWDNETGDLILTLAGHASAVNQIAFTPDGHFMATGSADGSLKLWDLSSGQEMLSLVGEAGTVNDMAINPTCVGPPDSPFDWCGPQLVSSHADGTIRIWDISPAGNQELLTVPGVDGWFSLDGREFISVKPVENLDENKVQIWPIPGMSQAGVEPANLHELRAYTLPFYDFVHDGAVGAISQDQKFVAVGNRDNELILFDHHSGERLRTISAASHAKQIISVAFHPDGSQLATSSSDGTAKVWDIATGQERFSLDGHLDQNKSVNFIDELQTVAFSPDGSRIATASLDGTAKIWDAATGAELLTLRGHTSWVWHAIFSPDGQRVATGSRDATAKIWDVATGEELMTLTGHTGIVTGLAFSPDGSLLATNSFDGTARVWDVATSHELLKWENSGPGLVHFSPDGTLLAAANVFNQTVQVFVLNLDTLMTLAQQRLTRSLTTEECRQFLHMETCPED